MVANLLVYAHPRGFALLVRLERSELAGGRPALYVSQELKGVNKRFHTNYFRN